MESEVMQEPPILDIDAYSEDVLANPRTFLDNLRETAPVVYLQPNEAYAVGRFALAMEVARDYKRFTSSHGMGLLDITKPGLLRPTNEMLESDPPRHTAIRRTMQGIMSPAAMREFQGMLDERAEQLVGKLVEKESVNGAKDIAQAFILSVFAEVIGIELPADPAVAVSTMMLNLMGPVNDVSQKAMANAEPHLEWFETATSRDSAAAGRLADLTYRAEEEGRLPPEIAHNMVVAFVAGGFDSTIAGIANTLLLLARNPDQWDHVRQDSSLVRPAFDEAVRLEPPFRAFYRMTTGDTELGGCHLAANTKIGVWMGAVNRDPRMFDRPDTYDVTRKGAAAGIGFGTGAHNCIGQVLARQEAAAIIGALARTVARLELVDEPEYHLHNQVRMPDVLPLKLSRN